MKEFEVIDGWYGVEGLYSYKTITLKPGVNIFVGCNGSGKTTLMNIIQEQLDDEGIKYLEYSDLYDGRGSAIELAVLGNDIPFAAQSLTSSEGEKMSLNFGKFCAKIGAYVTKIKKGKLDTGYIFIDALDSGLSLDNFVDIKRVFQTVMLDLNENKKEIYIVISSNNYELCIGERCIDVTSGKEIEFKSYDDFRDYVFRTRKLVDERYGIKEEEE